MLDEQLINLNFQIFLRTMSENKAHLRVRQPKPNLSVKHHNFSVIPSLTSQKKDATIDSETG